MSARRIAACLAFAPAYLSQARLDLANGKPQLAEFCLAKRKDKQRELAAIRAARKAAK